MLLMMMLSVIVLILSRIVVVLLSGIIIRLTRHIVLVMVSLSNMRLSSIPIQHKNEEEKKYERKTHSNILSNILSAKYTIFIHCII